jgi:hemerythrin
MAQTLAWQERFSVGVKGIDRQHRELLDRVNALFDAIDAHESGDQIESLVEFLKGYVHTHFACEERLMRRHAYPGYAHHLSEHQHFVDELTRIDALYQHTGAREELAARMSTFLASWLADHFQREDRAFAEHLSALPRPRASPATARRPARRTRDAPGAV